MTDDSQQDSASGRWSRVKQILQGARALPQHEREEYLDLHCGNDPRLREEVDSLLRADAAAGDFLAPTTDDRPPTTEAIGELRQEHPARIGEYRILQVLGEGGMGLVYLAEQQRPIRRRVALKVIKWGMDTQAVVARFEVERQALALMDHPHVAKVLDAGATEQGRPFFVMEYVKGVSITEYCDTHRLSTRERLELLTQMCDGVQHAHQKGIIHRDLKPSNALVTLVGDEPTVKIIDFGVAKATEQRLTEKTLFTALGMLVGTPEYMSPEQAEMTGLDIDTRTDVYSLGVILYELLVGSLPHDPRELRRAGFEEIVRRIREQEPPKPSNRLSTLDGSESTRLADLRRADPMSWMRQLRGDLDWIAMKALDKDRTRRYGSPLELAADLHRHLNTEPVLASPPSVAYRTGRFVRRHRAAVTLTGAAVLVLVAVAVAMTMQAQRVTTQRDLARQERDRAERTVEFLADTLAALDPATLGWEIKASLESHIERSSSRRRQTPEETRAKLVAFEEALDGVFMPTVAEELLDTQVLGQAARTIDRTLDQQPDTAALMHAVLARTYTRVGLYAGADRHYREAAEIRRRVFGEDHPDTLAAVHDLGVVALRQAIALGTNDFGKSEELLRSAHLGRASALGEDHSLTLLSRIHLGHALKWQRRFDEAGSLFRSIVDTRRLALGSDHPLTIESIEALGHVEEQQGRLHLAEPLFREALALRRGCCGVEAPGTLASLTRLGRVLVALDRHAEAHELFQEAVRTYDRSWESVSTSEQGASEDMRERLEKIRELRILSVDDLWTVGVITRLRSELGVRQIAEFRKLGMFAMVDSLDGIDRAEMFLRDLGLSVNVEWSHLLMDWESAYEGPVKTREFPLQYFDPYNALTALRALFTISGLQELEGRPGVRVEAPDRVLSSCVATLARLDELAASR